MKLKDKRCPSCSGAGYQTSTVGFSAYDGRPLQLPCQCPTCGGSGVLPDEQDELWLDVPGYVGRYQVSNQGNVKSLLRWRGVSNRMVTQSLHRHFLVVMFTTAEGAFQIWPVHRLVAFVFLQPTVPEWRVEHINGNVLDNRLDNLRLLDDSLEVPEEWRAVPGYEELYEVSDQGRVKSLRRKHTTGGILKAWMLTDRSRPTPTHYLHVSLSKSNCHRKFAVHRLVAMAFLGIPDPGQQIDHINGDSLDNRLTNLRLCERSQNQQNQKLSIRSTTHLKGAYYEKRTGRWKASIAANGKEIWLGRFDTPEAAHDAYCEAAKKYHGQFARFE